MKIGTPGSGIVGQALDVGFAKLRHEVKMASRDPNQDGIKGWGQQSRGKCLGGNQCGSGGMAVLATSWDDAESAIQLEGKVVIGVTNPLDFSTGGPALAVGHTDSGGELALRWLSDSNVVKAFNSIGNQHMVASNFPDGPPDMFLCGNDWDAKATVAEIC